MKNFHIMRNDKFINSFIKFINRNFLEGDNFFFVLDGLQTIAVENNNNIKIYISKWKNTKKFLKVSLMLFQMPVLFVKLFVYCMRAEKIYYHGLFDERHLLFLYIFRPFLKKASWVVWGGDFYYYYFKSDTNLTSFEKIYFHIDKTVKKRFKNYILPMEDDFKLIKEYYQVRGRFLESFVYPSNFYKEFSFEKEDKEEIWIQIGNSEDPGNNHIEILKKIELLQNDKVKLFCILSYTEEMSEYKKKIIATGEKKFGHNFFPITKFMPYTDYLKFLAKVDVAIFAHNRSQALGNISSLLSFKKTVYLKEEISTYKYFSKMGIKIKSFNRLNRIEIFSEEILENNKNIIKENFSENKLIEQWESIFQK